VLVRATVRAAVLAAGWMPVISPRLCACAHCSHAHIRRAPGPTSQFELTHALARTNAPNRQKGDFHGLAMIRQSLFFRRYRQSESVQGKRTLQFRRREQG
jgi:hypothetical protein